MPPLQFSNSLLLTMSFPYSSIYLNFNRIDMKKELRSRNTASAPHAKRMPDTRQSSKKQRPHLIQKRKLKLRSFKLAANAPLPAAPLPLHVKSDTQSAETTPDIPPCANLEDYLYDIQDHMVELDRTFHRNLQAHPATQFGTVITPEMRNTLVRWLSKVAAKFRVKSETLHMCIQLIDLMLTYQGSFFNRANFQLLGVASLFVSCKYHQIYTIEAEKYVELCEGIYSVSQLFEMQGLILLELGFNLQIPTLPQFADKLMNSCNATPEAEALIRTLIDMSLFDFNTFRMCKFELCSAIAYLVAKLYKLDDLKSQLSGYKNSINPDNFSQCFLTAMGLLKRSNLQVTSSF